MVVAYTRAFTLQAGNTIPSPTSILAGDGIYSLPNHTPPPQPFSSILLPPRVTSSPSPFTFPSSIKNPTPKKPSPPLSLSHSLSFSYQNLENRSDR